MAQVMINFRMDEETKKSMEQACREMGLSMTAAFTIFAKKVGKERRIPFEITVEPQKTGSLPEQNLQIHHGQSPEEPPAAIRQKRLALLCQEIRRSLTAIHIGIPSTLTGLPIEQIRLLCSDTLKDKTADIAKLCGSLFSGKSAHNLSGKNLEILDVYTDMLASITEDLRDVEWTLIPAMRLCSGTDTDSFTPYAQKLVQIARKLDGLSPVMQYFLCSSTAPRLPETLTEPLETET